MEVKTEHKEDRAGGLWWWKNNRGWETGRNFRSNLCPKRLLCPAGGDLSLGHEPTAQTPRCLCPARTALEADTPAPG